jgi:hypothetical protein
MQPDTSKWRLHGGYDYVNRLTPEGLAWEFLRRNKEYQRDFQLHLRNGASDKEDKALEQRWGLCFFRGTATQLAIAAHFMVAELQCFCSDTDKDTHRFCSEGFVPTIVCHDQKQPSWFSRLH